MLGDDDGVVVYLGFACPGCRVVNWWPVRAERHQIWTAWPRCSPAELAEWLPKAEETQKVEGEILQHIQEGKSLFEKLKPLDSEGRRGQSIVGPHGTACMRQQACT